MHGRITISLVALAAVLLLGFAGVAQQWGGRLVTVPASEINNLDPFMSGGWANRQAKENIFEPLVALDFEGNLEGRVASSWETSEDGTEIIFHIRNGMTFHDGSDLTAEDVKYSLDRARTPETGARSWQILEKITDVTVIDPNTIKLTFSAPDQLFMKQIYNYTMILPSDYTGDHAREPVGSGPFKLVEFTEEHLLLERFDDYYIEGLPYLDELEFKFIAEASTKVFQLETGAVDLVKSPPLAQVPELEGNSDIVLDFGESIEGPVLFFLPVLTMEGSPIGDARVRQALSYSLDRQQIIDVAFGGSATGSTARGTLVPADDPLYNPDQMTYERDVTEAKRLLAEAGYPDGVELDFYPLFRFPEDDAAATIIQQNAAEAGITLNTARMDVPTWVSALKNLELELPFSTTYSMPGAYEQMYMIQGRMHSGYIDLQNYDPVFYDRFAAAAGIADKDEFEAEVMELQRISAENQYVIVVGDIPTVFAMRTYVKNFRSQAVGSMYYRQVWIEK